MIKTEMLNDGTLIRHYSDAGYMLLQNETGAMYSDPIDVYPCRYTYTETDQFVDSDENGESLAGNEIPAEEFMRMVQEVL